MPDSSRPIKVLHVIARMNVGGPAVEITQLFRGIDPSVIEQALVTGFCGEAERDYLETQAPDVPALRIGGLGRRIRASDDLRSVWGIRNTIQDLAPDIVHTHTAKAGILGRAAAKVSGVDARRVHTFHGHLLHGYFSPPVTRAMVGLERAMARISDRLIAVGHRVRDDLVTAGIGSMDQYSVIHSGVPEPHSTNRTEARRILGIDASMFVIAWVGRLVRIKRPDRLCDVAAILRTRLPSALVIVAGGGEEEDYLRGRIAREGLPIRIVGWRNDVDTVYAASDVLLVTSDNEGIPLTILQAARHAVPVVATNVGAIGEAVESGVTGLLTSADPRELARAVQEIAGDAAQRSAMGAAASVRTSRLFSVERFLDDHVRLYRSMMGA